MDRTVGPVFQIFFIILKFIRVKGLRPLRVQGGALQKRRGKLIKKFLKIMFFTALFIASAQGVALAELRETGKVSP